MKTAIRAYAFACSVALGMAAAWMGFSGPANAQPSIEELGIPSGWLNTSQLRRGDLITFCADPNSDLYEFDRAVAQAIADRLLVPAAFVDLPSQDDIYATYFFENLYIALVNECDISMGMALVSGYPDWLTITRAYASFDYVMGVTDPAFDSIDDIPRDRFIGTQLTSLGEASFGLYMSLLPPEQRWRRLPYGDVDLMLTRLRDGTLGGAIIFEPTLEALVANGEADGIRALPLTGVANTIVEVGGVLLAEGAFLRSQVDIAIDSLVDDGSIDRILTEHGLTGIAGERR